MWDNPRLLNLAAGFLVGVAALGCALAGIYLVLRSELLPPMRLQIMTPLGETTGEEIEAALRGRAAGNFFAVDLAEVRAGLERLPWARRVGVRRVWPDRLEVSLEEHVALARWGDESLVNIQGERFFAKTGEFLPVFLGPGGAEAEVARRYARFAQALAPLGRLERVVLTPRFAWQLRLENGLHLMLGRDAELAEARLRGFVAVYDKTLSRVPGRHEYVDLRYPNGFAVRFPELRG